MIRLIQITAIFSLLAVLISCTGQQDAEFKINKLFQTYAQDRVPGAAVLVVKAGKPVYKKCFGLADLERNIPVHSNTNFRLASVTKQFTAMCIMILKERKKLDYEDSLTDIFTDFPEYGRNIKILNLLQHTSGLIDYESLIPDSATVQVHDADVLQMMQAQDSTYFAPGSKYQYSNSGYAILAMIVEKISDQSFTEFLKEHIFVPTEMENSVAFEKEVSIVKNRAYGYADSASTFKYSDQSLTSAVLGDGGIYASIEDLYKWDQLLFTEKLVKSKTLKRAFTPGVLNDGTILKYGFGWRIDDYLGHQRVHHTGSTCGFRNIIQRFPAQQLTIIMLTNRNQPDLTPIANQLASYFLTEK